MIGRYIRDRSMLMIVWISCAQGYEMKNYSQTDIINQLREKIMQSWSEVNIARAISPHHVDVFYHRIIKAHLELYDVLCVFVTRGHPFPEDLLPLYRILKGLYISHKAWCAEQKRSVTIGAYYLMCAILQMWCFATQETLPELNELSVDLSECKEQAELCYTSPE